MNRRGMSVLLIVCCLAFAIALVSLASHSLWRGSSRNLFGVQEHRELVNLCHSAHAEALFRVQTQLEQGAATWVDWCATTGEAPERRFNPDTTRNYAKEMMPDGSLVQYELSDVKIRRVNGLSQMNGMAGQLGVIEMEVMAGVTRARPAHSARVLMRQRRAFHFSDGVSAFSKGGRHVEITRNPLATFLEYP